MTLRVETAEADELAQQLSQLTGETVTEVVTVALRERLARERSRRASPSVLSERLEVLASRLRQPYDTRPVSRAEWDAASGDGA